MSTLARIVRWACLLAGLAGLVVSAWAFVDPTAFPHMHAGGFASPPSPRWRATLGFVFSLLLLGYGSGRLRHRELP